MTLQLSETDTYKATLKAAQKVSWRIEDIIGGEKHLNFNQPFMPEPLAGVQDIHCLTEREKLYLNQIRGNSYLYLFGVVEEFIVPTVLDHVRDIGTANIVATQAFLCFAEEEGKHIQLFRSFAEDFEAGFGTPCHCIGPAQAIAKAVLDHSVLGVALAILHIEWMTQRHYLESIRDNQALDPLFCSLLKHHWLEESQHTKLDALMIQSMIQNLNDAQIQQGIEDYFAIVSFLDNGLKQQVELDMESLKTAIGRTFTEAEKQNIQMAQEQAYRWTFLGSGMSHPNFIKTLKALSQSAAMRAEEVVEALGEVSTIDCRNTIS